MVWLGIAGKGPLFPLLARLGGLDFFSPITGNSGSASHFPAMARHAAIEPAVIVHGRAQLLHFGSHFAQPPGDFFSLDILSGLNPGDSYC